MSDDHAHGKGYLAVKMADENNDLFARAFGMYEEVRETVLSSDAYSKCVAATSYVSRLTVSAAGAAGSAAWVVGTAMVVGILPALFAVDLAIPQPHPSDVVCTGFENRLKLANDIQMLS
ncbi:hypothetical protein NDN08_003471 [Rhodosorus marinus]|uniref:Uncharacterized protein n=1 Tax=Rhodosorus marinus TaxID=101924 RepID=A0AAV8UZF6_9RHOD|nr:hypothetical protein NDN08_003471 [Rhodosorus marinus]